MMLCYLLSFPSSDFHTFYNINSVLSSILLLLYFTMSGHSSIFSFISLSHLILLFLLSYLFILLSFLFQYTSHTSALTFILLSYLLQYHFFYLTGTFYLTFLFLETCYSSNLSFSLLAYPL